MYRINYNNLSKKQVEDVLAKSAPPAYSSELCQRLAGQTMKIVLDKLPVEGPVLEYEFMSETKLALKENGAAAVQCDYGALTMKNITLFTHMIPGTKRGYTVIANFDTCVVTAFEMWFIDYEGEKIDTSKTYYVGGLSEPFVNREVQRQYYFGYFEVPGKNPPVKRDKLSLRLENAVINWKDSLNRNFITTYTSSTFSTFVEPDTPDGGDVLAFVSDILQVSDSIFIHSYGEVEYSGRLSVEVLDLFTMKKIGTIMGIDENDKFVHTLYTGCGKSLGRFATFYDFNDRGDQYSSFTTSRVDYSKKGARATYRPSIMAKKITHEELLEAAKNTSIFSSEKKEQKTMLSARLMDETDYCVGKTLTFKGDDGYTVEYVFKTENELSFRLGGEEEWHDNELYNATILDEDLVVIGHYRTGSVPPGCHILALDFKNGCATCLDGRIGGGYEVHDVVPNYHFGIIEMEGLTPTRIFRHGFTTELLGRAFTWTYSDTMTSIHIYNAPRSYSWTIVTDGEDGSPAHRAGGPVWSSPCEYVKLRDDVYLVNWVEQKWKGLMGTAIMNLRIMHDCGFTFAVFQDGTGITLDKLGAYARPAGKVDLSEFFPLTSYSTKT